MTMVGNGADILTTPNSGKNGGFGWYEVPKISNRENLSRVGIISHEIQKKSSSDLKYRRSPKTDEAGKGFFPRQRFPSLIH